MCVYFWQKQTQSVFKIGQNIDLCIFGRLISFRTIFWCLLLLHFKGRLIHWDKLARKTGPSYYYYYYYLFQPSISNQGDRKFFSVEVRFRQFIALPVRPVLVQAWTDADCQSKEGSLKKSLFESLHKRQRINFSSGKIPPYFSGINSAYKFTQATILFYITPACFLFLFIFILHTGMRSIDWRWNQLIDSETTA
jgi:hypothetical protein